MRWQRVDDGVMSRRWEWAARMRDSRVTRGARCSRGSPGAHVEMVREDLRMSKMYPRACENAIMVNGAIGGSTNTPSCTAGLPPRRREAHARRLDRLGRDHALPRQSDASGKYLMEDSTTAGGLRGRDREIAG